MSQPTANPNELIKTEADQVPPPQSLREEPGRRGRGQGPTANASDPELLREVERLAERVGGAERLRELVDSLERSKE